MLQYGCIPLWAALQIWFSHSFFAVWLEIKCRREETVCFLLAVWVLTVLFGFFEVQGLYAYLMYVLGAAVLLLGEFKEWGGKGLGLLVFAFVLSAGTDAFTESAAAGLTGASYYGALTAGKAFPLLLVLLLKWLKPKLAVSDENDADKEMLLLRQHMEMQQESMNALEQNYRLQRKSTHEFEHHLQVLGDLLETHEIAAAGEYLDRLKRNRSIHSADITSHHPVVDVILNQKYQTARENEIHMQIQVNDLSKIDIPSDSLVVLLTNLFDNAIEACRRTDGYREIICSILFQEELYISVRNTSEPVRIEDGKIPTSKADSLSHGFGLLSVSYVLDKLGAEYTFHYEEGWFSFAAEIDCG